MVQVYAYENKRNGEYVHASMDVVPESVHGPRTTVMDETAEEIVQSGVVANSWPVEIYEAFFKQKAARTDVQPGQDMNGEECLVVARDPKDDTAALPAGVSTLTRVRKRALRKEQNQG